MAAGIHKEHPRRPAVARSTRDKSRRDALAALQRWEIAWYATAINPAFEEPLRAAGVLLNAAGTKELGDSAELVLRGVQKELEQLASPVDYVVAQRLMHQRFQALRALIEVGIDVHDRPGQKYAKEILLEVTGKSPLTICMGDRYRIRHGERDGVMTRVGYLRFAVNGCLSIIAEDKRLTGGEMWAGLCDRCRNKARRDQGSELRRKVDAMLRGDQSRVRAGWASTAETSCDVSDRLRG